METIRSAEVLVGVERSERGEQYVPPLLTPMGNLHDLLAGNGGTRNDCISGNNTTGDGTPNMSPGCNF